MSAVKTRNAFGSGNEQDMKSTSVSGSLNIARQRIKAATEAKMHEAQAIKKELAKQMKKREKLDNQILKYKKQQICEIKNTENVIKSKYESLYTDKMNEVRLYKAS